MQFAAFGTSCLNQVEASPLELGQENSVGRILDQLAAPLDQILIKINRIRELNVGFYQQIRLSD